MKYVSPEYQQRLDRLASLLCTPERFGKVALSDQLEFDYETDLNGYAEVADSLIEQPAEQHGWNANGEYQ